MATFQNHQEILEAAFRDPQNTAINLEPSNVNKVIKSGAYDADPNIHYTKTQLTKRITQKNTCDTSCGQEAFESSMYRRMVREKHLSAFQTKEHGWTLPSTAQSLSKSS